MINKSLLVQKESVSKMDTISINIMFKPMMAHSKKMLLMVSIYTQMFSKQIVWKKVLKVSMLENGVKEMVIGMLKKISNLFH